MYLLSWHYFCCWSCAPVVRYLDMDPLWQESFSTGISLANHLQIAPSAAYNMCPGHLTGSSPKPLTLSVKNRRWIRQKGHRKFHILLERCCYCGGCCCCIGTSMSISEAICDGRQCSHMAMYVIQQRSVYVCTLVCICVITIYVLYIRGVCAYGRK